VTDTRAYQELQPLGDLAAFVYGEGGAALDDPAEAYHEASKLYPSFAARQAPGVTRLEAEPALQRLVQQSVRRHSQRRALELPRAELPRVGLAAALASRRSRRVFGDASLTIREVAICLHAAQGITTGAVAPGRTAPSGGALYPLELYLLAFDVSSLAAGLYHYDPLRHVLEVLRPGQLRVDVAAAMVFPECTQCSVMLVVTAMFWRTRCKYGLRGYRFALLEAGHAAQNALLAAAALELAALPVGGFYDRRLETLLRIDGVNESVLYCISIGSAPEVE
jgi:SagB-type dehydrogenase family enzyme